VSRHNRGRRDPSLAAGSSSSENLIRVKRPERRVSGFLPKDRPPRRVSDRRPMPTANLLDILAGQGLDPEAAQRLVDDLPAAGGSNTPPIPEKPVLARLCGARRREKMFGMGKPKALDRNAKVRIMHWARCLSRRTEKGRAYGVLTAKFVEVLRALLWVFHNRNLGWCFPSYETIAEAAGCARSTVAEAIKALEDAGIMSWVHRLKRVRMACPDLFGAEGVRIVPQRTSNAYHFTDPGTPGRRSNPPKSDSPSGTANQDYFSTLMAASGGERTGRSGRKGALRREQGANVVA
jgi:Helix-turn-helix domain